MEDGPAFGVGKEPGIAGVPLEMDERTAGTGAPRRLPAPLNADIGFLGGGVYFSCRRFATRSSTGWPGWTSRMCGGACLVISTRL